MDPQSISLIVAFGAGILSFLSPCVLPLVPVYITHLAGTSASSSQPGYARLPTLIHAVTFVAGFSTIFVLLGASVGLMGSVLYDKLPILRQVGGVFLIILGLHTIGILKIPFLYREKKLNFTPNPRLGYLSSFLIGVTFSAGWTPCVGTILGTILFLASTTETAWQGAYLLIAYSLGLGVPFLAAGAAIGSASNVLKRLNRRLNLVSAISGFLLIAMGIAVYADMLTRFTYLFYWTPGGL
ncbi:MAG: cytochrome c biogenesis protein CcdA [Chloroflexi bacterium]|nr:cytochrome c biogenesis protein CcdA [Chloroflexota bacterium]